jgi:D-glycero-D-manno-heptose 1,7-bisphosphate phosphatase
VILHALQLAFGNLVRLDFA